MLLKQGTVMSDNGIIPIQSQAIFKYNPELWIISLKKQVWSPFCWQNFHVHYLDRNIDILIEYWLNIIPEVSIDNVSTGSGNDLVPNRPQAIVNQSWCNSPMFIALGIMRHHSSKISLSKHLQLSSSSSEKRWVRNKCQSLLEQPSWSNEISTKWPLRNRRQFTIHTQTLILWPGTVTTWSSGLELNILKMESWAHIGCTANIWDALQTKLLKIAFTFLHPSAKNIRILLMGQCICKHGSFGPCYNSTWP